MCMEPHKSHLNRNHGCDTWLSGTPPAALPCTSSPALGQARSWVPSLRGSATDSSPLSALNVINFSPGIGIIPFALCTQLALPLALLLSWLLGAAPSVSVPLEQHSQGKGKEVLSLPSRPHLGRALKSMISPSAGTG